jgi:hypothetical protein
MHVTVIIGALEDDVVRNKHVLAEPAVRLPA